MKHNYNNAYWNRNAEFHHFIFYIVLYLYQILYFNNIILSTKNDYKGNRLYKQGV